MYEVACVGVLRRYRVAFLCRFTKQFKQKSTLKELLRPRLVGVGDSGGNRQRVPSESGNMVLGLPEYGPASSWSRKPQPRKSLQRKRHFWGAGLVLLTNL